MRAAQGHQFHCLGACVQQSPRVAHIFARDCYMVGIGVSGAGRFGRNPFDVQHGRCRRCAKRGAQRLQIIARRPCRSQSPQKRNTIGRAVACEITDQRPKRIVDTIWQINIDNTAGFAGAVQINPGQRRAASQRDTQIQKIRVFGGARAQNGIGKNHRVGFRPANIFAHGWGGFQKVRRTSETWLAAHPHIGVGQPRRRQAERWRNALSLPICTVHRNGVHRGWHANPRPHIGHLFGECQVGRAGINATVDMGLGDAGQPHSALIGRHSADDPHRLLHGIATVALKHSVVGRRQVKSGQGRRRDRNDQIICRD